MKQVTIAIILAMLLALAGCGADPGAEPGAEPGAGSGAGSGAGKEPAEEAGAPGTEEAAGTSTQSAFTEYPGTPTPEGAITEIPKGLEGSESAAYFAVIKQIATMWEGTYMGLDMANIEVDNPDQLIEMVRNYCGNNGMTLLIGDMDQMVENGYIESDGDMPVGFKDGYLIQFTYSKLTKKKLTAAAGCWYGNLGAQGGNFTVNKKDGVWSLNEEIGEMWIS
jgi:hypothetical protein